MILSKEFLSKVKMNSSDMCIDANKVVADRLDFSNKFANILSSFIINQEVLETLRDGFKKASEQDISHFINLFKICHPVADREYFSLCQIINFMLDCVGELTREQTNELYEVIRVHQGAFQCRFMKEDETPGICAANDLFRKLQARIRNSIAEMNGRVLPNTPAVTIFDQGHFKTFASKDESCNEATVKYNYDYSTFKTNDKVPVDLERFLNYLNAHINKEYYDSEYMIAHFRQIPDYIMYILTSGSNSDKYLSLTTHMIKMAFYYAQHDRYSLEELGVIILEVQERISEITAPVSFEVKNIVTELRELITNDILPAIANNLSSPELLESNPLVEMGFGYIYDILPDDCDNLTEESAIEIIRRLDEAAIEHNSLGLLQEACEILNEGFVKDIYDESKQKRRDKAQFKKELKEQKKKDKYDLKRQEQLDKYQAKRDAARQKLQDKYDLKRQKQQLKLEAKKERREEIKKDKEARKIATAETLKSLPMTNESMHKVREALNRAVKAAVYAGGASLLGINPVIGAACYLLPKYLSSKMNKRSNAALERSKVVSELDGQIASLDSKIDEMDRKGNYKAKANLQQLREKLSGTQARIAHTALSKGTGIIK